MIMPMLSKNVSIKSCHICKKDKNSHFIFDQIGSDLYKMDQNSSNLSKLDFSQTKDVTLKIYQMYNKEKSDCFILDSGVLLTVGYYTL